jgi:hypothetical protein
MGLMDQLGQAVGGAMGGQSIQDPLLQAVMSLLGQNSGGGGISRYCPIVPEEWTRRHRELLGEHRRKSSCHTGSDQTGLRKRFSEPAGG